MKRILILLLLGSGIFSSCNFLETNPEDFVTPENYYKNEADMERALGGVYNRLIDQYGRMYSRGLYSFLVISDEFYYKGISINDLRVMDFDAGHLDINKLWEVIYSGIDRANLLLENINTPDMDDDRRNEIRGEALFLRAYYYFLLTDNFGGVPLKLASTKSPTEPYLPRTSVKDMYAFIVKDMREAETLVSDISAYNYNERITKTVVQAVLARVFLTMAGEPLKDVARYNDALTYADKVIASGRHSLNPDYKQIFINHSQDKYDIQECLWEVGMYGNQLGSVMLAGRVGLENGVECPDDEIGYSNGPLKPTGRIFKLYGEGDLRRDWAIAPYKYVVTAGVTSKSFYTPTQIYERTVGKWRREYELATPKSRGYSSTNFPVMRYSDVLLMKAEASNEVKGAPDADAYEAINMVRRRGYGKPVNVPDADADVPAGLDQEAFRQMVRDERGRELAFEGMRKHDLIRWGIYISNMQSLAVEAAAEAPSAYKYSANAAKNTTPRNVLFPIPSTELTVNHLVTQNPNW
ncbi:RagB/SusD family nutrient uptake outer membrane protein [Chitinophaga sp. GCM10012297]|uniref:RagB/SusD family nutrient uptake outer membrane protein n=1 Tax=Chitinophaga chungangae TaxID=2821488 RepID=A0ABS3YBW7_9BACT|nr:RagB/SusD family nutrient uptake outer membrane protein [Chitinophaga chungangae]MBO9152156.1 RagB/SusD family nutrient uptake outer membrane protein [Chitinophaga chungangae]